MALSLPGELPSGPVKTSLGWEAVNDKLSRHHERLAESPPLLAAPLWQSTKGATPQGEGRIGGQPRHLGGPSWFPLSWSATIEQPRIHSTVVVASCLSPPNQSKAMILYSSSTSSLTMIGHHNNQEFVFSPSAHQLINHQKPVS